MLNLVEITDQKAITTSQIIAETFGKNHRDVMKAVRELECPEEFAERNFALGSYLDANNQARPMYQIARDGFTLLAMGFTGKKAVEFKIKFIEAFNAMEKALLDGQGETKRVEFEHNKDRRLKNPHGIDIKYNLDLTKIVMNPTRASLDVLEKLTGVDMSDVEVKSTGTHTDSISAFLRKWYLGKIDKIPFCPCVTTQLFGVYQKYCNDIGEIFPCNRKQFIAQLSMQHGWRVGAMVKIRVDDGIGRRKDRTSKKMIIPPRALLEKDDELHDDRQLVFGDYAMQEGENQEQWLGRCYEAFQAAVSIEV